MLAVQNIDSFYGRSQILHQLSMTFESGAITAVLGRNGTGKSTLLKTIMGLTDRMTGDLRLDETNLSSSPTFRRARAGIGYVPQGRGIIPDFTVRENILMGGFAASEGEGEVPDIVPKLFPYLKDNMSRSGGLLSGGQQQQLSIARALAMRPSILLLDEPTEGIQPNIVEEIENVIIKLNREVGLTIILVEQSVRFARKAASSYLMMEKGRNVSSGPIGQLTDDVVHRHMAV